MQLLYIYIGGYIEVKDGPYKDDATDEAYRVLKDIELNLSNKFVFNFNKETKILNLELNESYIPNFFDPEGQIKNVSAIIGKNGTGKTSIIELIKWLQPDNLQSVPYKLILIYGEVDLDSNQVFIILKNDELKLELSDKFSKSIEIKDFYRHNSGIFKGLSPFDHPYELDNLKQIYYSPVFEVQFSNLPAEHEVLSDKYISDISTSNLLEQDAKDSINGSTQNLNAREVLVRHKMMDVERQYRLIKDHENFKDILGFEKPNYIELIIDNSDYRFVKDNDYVIRFDSFFSTENVDFNPQTRNQFLYRMMRFSFYNMIRNVPINYHSESLTKEINDLISSLPRISENTDFQEWLKQFKSNCLGQKTYWSDIYVSRLEFILQFFSLEEVDKRFRYANNVRCRLNLNEETDVKILLHYFDLKSLTGFLHLDWKFNYHNNGELSSGEKAKFNLFSRFYSASKAIGPNSDILILLDEGDTLFHPEWQRTYLNDFLKCVKVIFSQANSIQIILTTHSPFVSSDLPWYSIVRLDKDQVSGFTRVDYNNSKPTFAANIHDLFADSFYMDKGFVGAFAVEKIKDLFERIKKTTKDQIPALELEIKLIGEPFIQMSLLEALKEDTSYE